MPDLLESLKFALGNVQRGGGLVNDFLSGNPDPGVLGSDPLGGSPMGLATVLPKMAKFDHLSRINLKDALKRPGFVERLNSRMRAFINSDPAEMYAGTPEANWHSQISNQLGYKGTEDALDAGLMRFESDRSGKIASTVYSPENIALLKKLMEKDTTGKLGLDIYTKGKRGAVWAGDYGRTLDQLDYNPATLDRFINDLLAQGKLK